MGSCGSSQGPLIVGCLPARTKLHDPQTYTKLLITLTWILGLAMPAGATRFPLPLAPQSSLDSICDHQLTGDKRSGTDTVHSHFCWPWPTPWINIGFIFHCLGWYPCWSARLAKCFAVFSPIRLV